MIEQTEPFPLPGFVVWLTGLSGAGKTTVAHELAAKLERRGVCVEHLDGDELRQHLCIELGFSRADRDTNVARVAWIASRVARAGGVVIVSLLSPYTDARRQARRTVEATGRRFYEIYVSTPLEVCIERDPKGLYAKALAGEITSFTGISDPYEPPAVPDLELDTTGEPVEASAERVCELLAGQLALGSDLLISTFRRER